MTTPKSTAAALKRALGALATPEKAKSARRFFKAEKGGYAEGDRFIGVVVRDQRRVARSFADLPLSETKKLLKSPIHEHRLTALHILVRRYEREPELRPAICRLYLEQRAAVNNWDLVDSSAHQIVGAHLDGKATCLQALERLARSRSLWDRRIAVIATYHFIRKGQFDITLRIAELLLSDDQDLIHKAVGWMLREVGNRDLTTERVFLDRHAPRMPRTMLRYAIEKFPVKLRKEYMSKRRA